MGKRYYFQNNTTITGWLKEDEEVEGSLDLILYMKVDQSGLEQAIQLY